MGVVSPLPPQHVDAPLIKEGNTLSQVVNRRVVIVKGSEILAAAVIENLSSGRMREGEGQFIVYVRTSLAAISKSYTCIHHQRSSNESTAQARSERLVLEPVAPGHGELLQGVGRLENNQQTFEESVREQAPPRI